jgi:arylsulfatase A-like enzyme
LVIELFTGLPESMVTMPQLLRQSGYNAHMIGKWHIGHSQWKQGPVGRGFETHVGSLMWNLESYTKLLWKNPWQTVGADWGRHFENGSYEHFAEPRHATIALTDEALTR